MQGHLSRLSSKACLGGCIIGGCSLRGLQNYAESKARDDRKARQWEETRLQLLELEDAPRPHQIVNFGGHKGRVFPVISAKEVAIMSQKYNKVTMRISPVSMFLRLMFRTHITHTCSVRLMSAVLHRVTLITFSLLPLDLGYVRGWSVRCD